MTFAPATLAEYLSTDKPEELIGLAREARANDPASEPSHAAWLWSFLAFRATDRLATRIKLTLERLVDANIFAWGTRDGSPALDPAEWDDELEALIVAEFAPMTAAVPETRDALHGVGIGAGAVYPETVAAEVAQRYAKAAWHSVRPIDFSYAGMPGDFLVRFLAAGVPAPAAPHPPLSAPPPPLPGARPARGVAKGDEAEAVRRMFAALAWDADSFAAMLDVSAGTVRNYAAGRSVPKKPLTSAQARALHAEATARAQSLQEAAMVFAAAVALDG